jgi:hypothetical protein
MQAACRASGPSRPLDEGDKVLERLSYLGKWNLPRHTVGTLHLMDRIPRLPCRWSVRLLSKPHLTAHYSLAERSRYDHPSIAVHQAWILFLEGGVILPPCAGGQQSQQDAWVNRHVRHKAST